MTSRFHPQRRALLALALAAGAMLPAAQAQTATWPSKPVRVIVNFPPGGAADQLARAVGEPLAEALGQPVVIENRGGADGNIGGEAVAKSATDGYTLLMSSGGMVSVNPHLYAKMSFDPAKDLTPVAAAARVLVFLVVSPRCRSTTSRSSSPTSRPTRASCPSARRAMAARRTWRPR